MKKLVIILTAALLALTICAAALANDTAAAELYDAAVKLLFYTHNVTVNVKADFSLDGEWFKTAEATMMQDHNRSFHQLMLRSPRADGSERKNGYTVIVDGEKLNLMEVFTPGVYRTGTTAERDSILRRSAESGLMLQLGYGLAGQAETLLGSDAVTREADGSYSVKLGNDIPLLVNAAAGQVFRFAAKRYFDVDYDMFDTNYYMSMHDFVTKTAGILYTARDVSVREAGITIRTDGEGRLQHAEGTVGLYVGTAVDGVHQLDITFRAEISDIGSTVVKKFNPADYDVVRASDDAIFFTEEGAEIQEDVTTVNGALIDEIEKEAMRIWEKTGFNTVATTSVGCRMLDNGYVVSFEGGYDPVLESYFTLDGRFTFIQTEPNEWQYADNTAYNYDPRPDAKTDQTAKEFLMDFLSTVHPELLSTVKDLKMEWIYESDGAVYAQYLEHPLDQEGDGVLFVIRVRPEMRIEYYSCVSNG